MNDIEDIIVYNNMKNINKIDNYLFHKNDYNNFIEKYHNKICNLFFDNNNNIKEDIELKKENKEIIDNKPIKEEIKEEEIKQTEDIKEKEKEPDEKKEELKNRKIDFPKTAKKKELMDLLINSNK